MGLFSKLFAKKKDVSKRPPQHEVEVHFLYGSTNFQHLYALEDQLRTVISEAAVGVYEGHETPEDGSDGFFYMYGPDAEALFRVIRPILAKSSFMQDATVTLWFGPRRWKTQKRVIELSRNNILS
jgi:hypothetical protein